MKKQLSVFALHARAAIGRLALVLLGMLALDAAAYVLFGLRGFRASLTGSELVTALRVIFSLGLVACQLLLAGCFGAGMVMLTIKPHVAARFASWGHIWEDVYDKGFQQTHTLTAAASGGLIGVGAGKGWLSGLPAADTDIVFGMLCEEWGLVIAVLTVLCIITLAVFAVRACRAGRSSFYTIAACAATSLLVFQTCLNVFGAVDILPFTGVTLPFVSTGGSSMLSAWGMLAFLKATDTRQNASFAVRLPSRRELRGED